MVTQYKILAWAALASLVLGLSYGLYSTRETLSATRTKLVDQTARVEAAEAHLGQVQAAIRVANTRAQVAEKELRNVLKDHKEWADAPVPAPVADGLCQFARCAPK